MMRQETTARWCGPFLASFVLGLFMIALTTASGCNADVARGENSSPIVRPDTEEGRKAQARADAFVKLRQEQEAKARAKAAKRKRAHPLPVID